MEFEIEAPLSWKKEGTCQVGILYDICSLYDLKIAREQKKKKIIIILPSKVTSVYNESYNVGQQINYCVWRWKLTRENIRLDNDKYYSRLAIK